MDEAVQTNFSELEVADLMGKIAAVRSELGKRIVGQEQVKEQVLTCLLAGGHSLLEGVPGLGKTVLVRSLGEALELKFSRVQFTPDLMPADIVGTHIVNEETPGQRKFVFQPGPVFTNLLLADEINRATPKTQSSLLEAMQERQVTVGSQTRPLPNPFFVLATQNPIEMEGTYPLPEAQMDRFLFKISVSFPQEEELLAIVGRTTGVETAPLRPVADGTTVLKAMALVRAVPAAQAVVSYAVRLVMATHPESEGAPADVKRFVRFGASPRGAQALILAGKARALMEGRYNVSFDDIRSAASPALRHRVFLNFDGEAQGLTTDKLVQAVLEAIPETR